MNETTNRADSGAGAESGLPVGVVTVTYSPGEHLRALVDSLPGATTVGTVLVMADNGSKDEQDRFAAGGCTAYPAR